MLSVLIAALLQGEPAAASAGPSESPFVTEPDWLTRPSAKDVAKYFPSATAWKGMAGLAAISCSVRVTGELSDCSVFLEDPPGLGFGEAALAMSHLFRMKPMTRDGQPVPGGTVRIPVRFSTQAFTAAPVVASHPRLRAGKAEVNCRISAEERLENCFVQWLEPYDPELRATALQLAARFKVTRVFNRRYRLVLPIEFRAAPVAPAADQPPAAASLR